MNVTENQVPMQQDMIRIQATETRDFQEQVKRAQITQNMKIKT